MNSRKNTKILWHVDKRHVDIKCHDGWHCFKSLTRTLVNTLINKHLTNSHLFATDFERAQCSLCSCLILKRLQMFIQRLIIKPLFKCVGYSSNTLKYLNYSVSGINPSTSRCNLLLL